MTRQSSQVASGGNEDPAGIDWQSALMKNERWLRTVVFSRLRDRDAVDEVMQEIALAAARQAAPLNSSFQDFRC